MKTIVLQTRDQRTPLVEFFRMDSGAWAYRPAGTTSKAVAHELVRHIASYGLRRRVAPREGELFENALKETYGRSSAYQLVEREATPVRRSSSEVS